MTRWSACIELLFKEAGDFPDRIRAAKAAGMDAVEFWRHSNKDLVAVGAALRETGLPLAGILCEPIVPLTDPSCHDEFLDAVGDSIKAAQKLGAPMIIAQSGNDRMGVPRVHQHGAIVEALNDAARVLAGTGVVLALEPLNDVVDHKGYYLTSTAEGLDIVDEVGRPEIRLLYDIYHSAMMGERPEDVLAGRMDRVVHVHLADVPGRGEPGSGKLDWRERLGWIEANSYKGLVGLEYTPTAAIAAGSPSRPEPSVVNGSQSRPA